VALGDALGVPAPLRRALRLGGYLHDLGKIAVADRILLKPGHLDAEERRSMALHPHVGDELVRDLRSLDDVRPLIRHHHERLDGTGYPDGLRGDAIPLGARIMAVVDVYDALRTARPYKMGFSREEASRILLDETEGGAWDPIIVTTFLGLIREHGEGPR
jgi:putative two-component system response regulator